MSFAGARILVVGGAGFVGSNLVRELLGRGAGEIVVVDNLLSSERENLPTASELTFVEGSITNDDVLRGLPEDLDHVFHLATFHGNQSSIADPLADHENNTLTTLKLFERLSQIDGIGKVVYASAGCTVADKTFDGAESTDESAPVSLWHDSPYQISKLIGEFYANYYLLRHDLPVVKARFQNVYGPGEVLGAGSWRGTPHTVWRNVTPTFVYKALKEQALPLEHGGETTRDFIYVDDIVAGLIACALRGGPGEVYNLASGVETPIKTLAEQINELAGNPAGVEIRPARAWDRSGQRYGATEKARREIDFEATVALRDGLERTVDWTRDNLAFIDACIAKHADRLAEAEARSAQPSAPASKAA